MAVLRTPVCRLLTIAMLGSALASAAEVIPQAHAIELRGEPAALTLDHTMFAGKPADHRAFSRPNISRSDWIQSGSMATRVPNITVVIERRSVAQTERKGVVDDLNELSALKSRQVLYHPSYHELTTKYGTLRAVVFDLAADGIRKYCTGFHTPGHSRLYIKGFVCAMNAVEVSPQVAACTLDKLRFTRKEDETAAIELGGVISPNDCGAIFLDPDAAAAPAGRTE